MQIPITIMIPITPTAFFKIIPHPKTVSTASPRIFPTTGIAELTTAFVVLAVIPSTLLESVPSNEITATKMVRIIPKNHTTPDFKKFDNLSICTLFEILDITIKLVKINTIGIIRVCIIFPIKLIKNNIIGSSTPLVVILPVYIINEMSKGINIFTNPIKLLQVSFTTCTMSEKFIITIVTINMY